MKLLRQPSGATGKRAFTLAELLITIACAVVIAALFLPALAKQKARSSRLNCGNNLKQVGLAFRTWSLDNSDRLPMQVPVVEGGTMELVTGGAVYPHFQVMSNELSTPKVLLCPADEKRSYATNFGVGLVDTNLSYFINMDATNGDGASLLSGDRNLTNKGWRGGRLVALKKTDSIAWTKELHSQKGYIGFADGRVDRFGNANVGLAIQGIRGTANRLAVP